MRSAGLTVRHLGRYRDIALLLNKYARSDVGRGVLDGEEPSPGAPAPAGGPGPAELAADLERLGPTFIKLGQLMSTRADMLPASWVVELERLQDRVKPFPAAEARRVVETELGARVGRLFREFDDEPVAAASLSQIHRAKLRDGRVVAVKIQRPGVRETIVEDMEALSEAASFLDRRTKFGRRYETGRVVSELRKTLLHELDFAREAMNLRELADNLAEFDKLVVPEPVEGLTTARVLTMAFIRGRKVTTATPLRLQEVESRELADQLFRAYLKQILVDGFFHADPHPGNLLLTNDGRVAVLDLGMVERIGPELQQELLSLMLAIGEGRAEDAASAAIRIGVKRETFQEGRFRSRIAELVLSNKGATISEMDVGRIIFEIARFAGTCGLRLPQEMTMIGKALLNLDQVVRALDPDFDPAEAIRAESVALLEERMEKVFTRSNAAAGLLEVQKFASKLPQRLGKVLDVLGGNELRVKVDAVDENLLIQGMQKIANRISLGVVLASLIIGAALMMRVPTSFRIFEYPGLAILLFLGAAAASLIMVADILYYDDKRRARPRGADDPPREKD